MKINLFYSWQNDLEKKYNRKTEMNTFTQMSEFAINQQKNRSNSRSGRKSGLQYHKSENLDDLVNKQ